MRLGEKVLAVVGAIFLFAVACLLIALFNGCAHFTVGPDTNDPGCNPTDQFRDYPYSIHFNMDCYSCKGALSCRAAGNHWCCADDTCTDCESSPVNFGTKRPDGGVSNNERCLPPCLNQAPVGADTVALFEQGRCHCQWIDDFAPGAHTVARIRDGYVPISSP